jgi:predicted PhzF superfamily epimerase YddE/YHI9
MSTEVLRYTAFSADPAGGNPAGVVLDATGLDDAEMQRIAAKVGYSETAFLTAEHDRNYRIRYFSPFPIGGVAEDAATGAAAAAFGGYLREIDYAHSGRITIEQGVDMGRPSLLQVDLVPDAPGVRVTGHAVPID